MVEMLTGTSDQASTHNMHTTAAIVEGGIKVWIPSNEATANK